MEHPSKPYNFIVTLTAFTYVEYTYVYMYVCVSSYTDFSHK